MQISINENPGNLYQSSSNVSSKDVEDLDLLFRAYYFLD